MISDNESEKWKEVERSGKVRKKAEQPGRLWKRKRKDDGAARTGKDGPDRKTEGAEGTGKKGLLQVL